MNRKLGNNVGFCSWGLIKIIIYSGGWRGTKVLIGPHKELGCKWGLCDVPRHVKWPALYVKK